MQRNYQRILINYNMKYVLTLLLALSLCSCANEKTLNGVTYQPYGWADYQELKSDKVIYKACTGNIIWSVVTFETIVIPVWLTGWQLYEPVALKSDTTLTYYTNNK